MSNYCASEIAFLRVAVITFPNLRTENEQVDALHDVLDDPDYDGHLDDLIDDYTYSIFLMLSEAMVRVIEDEARRRGEQPEELLPSPFILWRAIMTDERNLEYFGRPADGSLEAFKAWLREFMDVMDPTGDPITEDEWKAA